MGFSRRLAKNYAATGSRRRRRKRGPGNSATPLTNIVKLARSKRDSQQAKTHVDHLLFQLVDDIHSIWDANSFLDRAEELVKKAI